MWIDTTRLPDIAQRAEPLELIGQVIGTAGTVPYVHLQLEMSRQLFGDSMPTLVANDGTDRDTDRLRQLAEEYGADFVCWEACGHAPGDVRIFYEAIHWAKKKGLDIVAKFSRRAVPLISWRHQLQYLAAFNTDAAFFTRRHLDTPSGLFRTDAIAFRVRCLYNERVLSSLKETFESKIPVNVESMMEAFSNVCGGWAVWDLLGPNFYKPWKNLMQWRGLLPYHYGDLARQLNLPYRDIDFLEASFGRIRFTKNEEPAPSSLIQVLQIGGDTLVTDQAVSPQDHPGAISPGGGGQ